MGKGREWLARWRWAVRPLAVCAVLAVLTTVGFAWLLENAGPMFITEQCDFDEHYASDGAEWMEFHCFGGRAYEVYAPRRSAEEARRYYANVPGVTPADPPGFVRRPGPGMDGTQMSLRGWPLPCLYQESSWTKTGNGTARLAWEGEARGQHFSLSYGVRWLAMIADVALYTAVFAAVPFGRHAWRHKRRREAGHCPGCNYDRTGLPWYEPCPECGAGASSK